MKFFDYTLLILVCIVVIFGIVVIGSATHINVNGNSPVYRNQIIWFLTGLVFLLIIALVDNNVLTKAYIPAYVLNIILLVAVIVQNHDADGVSRSLGVGNLGIQPSEFSKIFMIIFIANFIDKNKDTINSIYKIVTIIGLTLVPVVLIIIQPSLSAGLVTMFILIAMLFVGGLDYKYIYRSLIAIIPLGILFIVDITREAPVLVNKFLKDYQIKRILDLISSENSEGRYQTNNSVAAIASGQLEGKGIYEGTLNQLNFLAESHNDFVFAVIGEEFGFIGSISIILLMAMIVIRCYYIANKAHDLKGKLIASGVGSLIAFQVVVNICVATDMLPNTGMSLPFISYGGSAMWINMMAIGLVMNVGMTRKKSMFEE